MINFQTYKPLKISSFIKLFWRLEISNPNIENYVETIVPDGHFEIIFHLNSNSVYRMINNKKRFLEPLAFIAGQNLNSYSLEMQNNSVIYGIRFHPHTLIMLLSIDAEEITDTIIDTDLINIFKELKYHINDSAIETFKILETLLFEIIKKNYQPKLSHQIVEYSVKKILSENGNSKIEDIIQKSGYSHKYFNLIFKKNIGINPKQFANIIKLNHFISITKAKPKFNLTECTYESNFFDQAHLTKTFKKFTKTTPKKFISNNQNISEIFSDL